MEVLEAKVLQSEPLESHVNPRNANEWGESADVCLLLVPHENDPGREHLKVLQGVDVLLNTQQQKYNAHYMLAYMCVYTHRYQMKTTLLCVQV